MNGEAAAALLAMSTAPDRRIALLWAMTAVLRGLPAAEAQEAFRLWDQQAAASVQEIGGQR